MAVGDLYPTGTETPSGNAGSNTPPITFSIKLMEAQATANNPPTLTTDGVSMNKVNRVAQPSREATVVIKGSGTVTSGQFRMWGYSSPLAAWVPVGPGPDASKGYLNSGQAMGVITGGFVLHSESFYLAGHFERLYLELIAPVGGGPLFSAWLVVPHELY